MARYRTKSLQVVESALNEAEAARIGWSPVDTERPAYEALSQEELQRLYDTSGDEDDFGDEN